MPLDSKLLDYFYSLVERIYRTSVEHGGRLPGTPGDRAVEELVRGELEQLGLEVKVEPVRVRYWKARNWKLEIETASGWVEVPSFYMARVRPGTVEARLAYIGDAHSTSLPQAVEGSIAVGELEHPSLDLGLLAAAALYISDPDGSLRAAAEKPVEKPATFMTTLHPSECGCPVAPEAYDAAVKRGAAGFVAVLRNYPDMGCGEFTYYAPSDGLIRELTGLWVHRSNAKTLLEAAKQGARARLTLEADVGEATGYNVYAVLPGSTEKTIVVHSHHDSPFGGAVQDASGVAAVLALAHAFKDYRPKHTIVFLLTEGHFDAGSGQEAFMESYGRDRIRVDIAVEHLAKEYAVKDGKIYYTGKPEPRAVFVTETDGIVVEAFRKALKAHQPARTLLLPTSTPLGVPSDANRFWRRGVPVASMISGPVYMFSSCDTPDKVTERSDLERVLNTFLDAIKAIDSA